MMISIIISITIATSISCRIINTLEFQLCNLSKEIYSMIPKEELDFLSGTADGTIMYWLINKYADKYSCKIDNRITHPSMSMIQDSHKMSSVNSVTPKQALVFAYVTARIANKPYITTNDSALLANSFLKSYSLVNLPLDLIIDNKFNNYFLESKILVALDLINLKIIDSLTDIEKKYLSTAPDLVILQWIFAKKWANEEADSELTKMIINYIDDEMLNYLINKYKINVLFEDEFKCFIAAGYLAEKLKNSKSDLRAAVQLFYTNQYMTMPRPDTDIENLHPASRSQHLEHPRHLLPRFSYDFSH